MGNLTQRKKNKYDPFAYPPKFFFRKENNTHFYNSRSLSNSLNKFRVQSQNSKENEVHNEQKIKKSKKNVQQEYYSNKIKKNDEI